MLTPFLTALDYRAAIKGSQDPLGAMPIWIRLGRKLIGNLTTVSTSVRDFTILLLGLHLIEQIQRDGDTVSEVEAFLKWEQLAGYARAVVNRDSSFRGTERVHRNLNEDFRVTISAAPQYQILSSQKLYGLWGLYTVPSRSSGFLEVDGHRLTPTITEFIQSESVKVMWAQGSKVEKKVIDILNSQSKKIQPNGDDKDLLKSIARAIHDKYSENEQQLYSQYLLEGGPNDSTGGVQQLLQKLIAELPSQKILPLSPSLLWSLEKRARRLTGAGETLANRLASIRHCESVLALSASAFVFLLGHDGRPIKEIAATMKDQWGAVVPSVNPDEIEELQPDLGLGDRKRGQRWVDISCALSEGDYFAFVRLLTDQNAAIMNARGGTPWAEIRNGRLAVRYKEERGMLPSKQELPNLWRYPYFLDSLRSVSEQLRSRA